MNESTIEIDYLLAEDIRVNQMFQSCYTGAALPNFSGSRSASPVWIKKQ